MLVLCSQAAQAFDIDTGNPDFKLRWDNTVKYSAAWRTQNPSSKLSEGQVALNQDDGDRAFKKGLISNRTDILSELDLSYQDFGARLSGAAWYDSEYQGNNENNDPSRANARSVDYDEFTDDTRHLHGGDAEILDAFVYWNGELADRATSVRAGRHGLIWGESLFFGANGIAGGMAPVDVVKAQSVPNTQFKEITRPVNQLSGTFQLTDDVSLGGFYQFEWEETRLPAAGSYFSTSDTIGEGTERLIVGAPFPGFLGGNPSSPAAFFHGNDKEARSSGQGGLQLKYNAESVEYGLYAIQYHDKTPKLYLKPSAGAPNFSTGQIGEYYWVYPEDIRALGASFSTTMDEYSFAGEASMRWNMPLVSNGQTVLPGVVADNDDHALYAVGRTAHVNLNVIASFGPNFLARESGLVGEVAWNRLLSVTKNRAALDPNATDDGLGLKLVYTPTYRQFFSGVDISIPVGVSYFPLGKSAVVSSFGPDNGGDFNIGITATYLDRVTAGLTYTHYYGAEDTNLNGLSQFNYKQSLKDRDYLAFSVKTTF
ncbi:glycine/betaine transmethylase [Pseudomonas moraviensis]|nr:glycine/betaine transmethylase [Pseudomonas moraviensis]